MRRSFRGNRDQNDDKRDERRIHGCGGNSRKDFAVAIEDEGERVDHLIGDEHMPRLVRTAHVRDERLRGFFTTHNSGWESCQHPTPALATAMDTLAEVKILPAQENHPVRYDAKLACRLGASSMAQKHCPPAFG